MEIITMTLNLDNKALATTLVVRSALSLESSIVVLTNASVRSNNDSIELAGVSMFLFLGEQAIDIRLKA